MTGWNRTFILGVGAAIGVLAMALLIHFWKGGKA